MTGFGRRVCSRFGVLVLSAVALALVVTVAAPPGALASRLTLLDVPGATYTEANGINSHGAIVGFYVDTAGRQHGFLWHQGSLGTPGGFTTIDVPFQGATSTVANGISDSGQIVGAYGDATTVHGFLFDRRTYTTIDFPGATSTSAVGTSRKGIVGSYADPAGLEHGFLWDGHSFTTIDAPGAPVLTVAYGIDRTGRSVGTYLDALGGVHGFLLNGHIFTYPIDVPGALYSVAAGISSPGGIVGSYVDALGGLHGFFTPNASIAPTTIDACGAPASANGIGTRIVATVGPGGGITTRIVGSCTDKDGTHGFLSER